MDLFPVNPFTGSAPDASQTWQRESSIERTPYPAQFTPQDSPPKINTASEAAQPKKRGRKGHSKSRTGCFNCKKARIKCKENKPDCDYCAHRGLRCEWPDLQVHQQHAGQDNTPSSHGEVARRFSSSDFEQSAVSLPIQVHTQGPVFNMQDFRLFNFFIQSAYPHHPIGNDKVWRHEIPCIASDYDFLLYSMLGLSASELACSTDPTPEMHSTALAHRVKAISSLNTAITRGITCYEEGNAMLATCFSLLFQSCLLEDGLVEYMTFIRGTISIGFTMGRRQMRFIFDKLFGNERVDQVDPMMQITPLIQPEVVQAANRSFENLAPLCVKKVELEVFGVLSSIARALITSSRDAYMNLRKMYELFSYTMTQPDFQEYCNPTNAACQILQAHFVALQLVMAPVTRAEFTYKEEELGHRDDANGKTVAWLVGIHRRVPRDLKGYFAWTMWVEREVLSGALYNGRVRDEDIGSLGEAMKGWNEDWGTIMNGKE